MADLKSIKEELARAKGYFHRHEILRSMISVAAALKAVIGAPLYGRDKLEVGSALAEMVCLLNRADEVKKYAGGELKYQGQGDEKALFAAVVQAAKKAREAQSRESEEALLNRKLMLDKALIRGKRLLAAGKTNEALESFKEAVSKYYHDEHSVFRVIGGALLDASLPRPALPFLKKGLEKEGQDPGPMVELARAMEMLKDYEESLRYLKKALSHSGDDPDIMLNLGRVYALNKDPEKGLAMVRKVLEITPGSVKAKAMLPRLEKAAARARG